MKTDMTCGRREDFGGDVFKYGALKTGQDRWIVRDGHRHCSYCGSLDPAELFDLIERGVAVLGPTDKNYKVYVDVPNPKAGRRAIVGSKYDGSKPWPFRTRPIWGRQSENLHLKFYFQHFDTDQKKLFVRLYNERRIRFDSTGGFYRLPFFMERAGA